MSISMRSRYLAVLCVTLGGSVALGAAGEFDPSFNRVGFTRERVGQWSSGGGLAIHSSGEIVTAGGYSDSNTQNSGLVLWQHLANGTPDKTFGSNGVVYPLSTNVVSTTGSVLALDSQERVVLLTIGRVAGGGEYFVYRFNRLDGSPDLSFSPTGRVSIRTGANIYGVVGLVIQPDDKVLGVGGAVNQATGRWEFFLFRLQEDGELDSTFGDNGRVWTSIRGYDRATGVALQPDGKIVVAGRAKINFAANYDFALARYTAEGELDDSFGDGGSVVFPVLDDNLGRKLVIQPDGKIVIAGYACEDTKGGDEYCFFGVARVDGRGVLDPSFGGTGIVHTDVGDGFPYDVALQPDNKIVALGIHGNLTDFRSNVVLVRYLPDGSLDGTFGYNGISETNYGYLRNAAGDIRIQADGQIVVCGGTAGEYSPVSAVVARYQATGGEPVATLPQSTSQPGSLAP